MQSIILKGDDSRVQTLDVQDLSGRPRSKSKSVKGQESCETRIEVLRQGQDVRGIEVHCSCGEVTVIELTYPQA
ncbi:MAG: hypothetical protein H6830_09445 [Planctomycetes bacterium]|nr:hypothetical protein [Planctomycetota bacterium]MCB9909948.1 hypothetical protein [Planctomycetota bacterium]MCB9912915.1 hypothetical protein [Planctomycetota bacterium]HPF13120.1 hypothetical protein [Planctomycetota bacterium]HRV80072.1 hypothetical protein [Planctomycetota bacterium]